MLPKGNPLQVWGHNRLKIKEQKRYPKVTGQNKAGVVIITLDQVEFRANLSKDQEDLFIMMEESVHQRT